MDDLQNSTPTVQASWDAEGRHPRLNECNQIIKEALGSAHISARREPKYLSRNYGKRPDGLITTAWSKGKSLVWDVTCTDTLAPSHIDQTSQEAGKAALKAEKGKLVKYECLAAQYIVMPIAFETLGPMAPMGLKFIKEIGSRIADISGDKRATRLGISTQRGNATSIEGIEGTVNIKELEELYYI